MLQLSKEEKAVRNASDEEVEEWLAGARKGEAGSRERLCSWAFLTAHDYYRAKVGLEKHLTSQDAEELTSEFFVDFEQSIHGVRTAVHFTRRLLKKKLGRYLERKKKIERRESPQSRLDDIEQAVEEPSWERWSDVEWLQYRATMQTLAGVDGVTRSILEGRAEGLGFARIAEGLGLSEAAARMRAARFYKAVRDRCKNLKS